MTSKLRPWRVTGSRYALEDRWIRVRADDCVTASGTEVAPFYVLEYPDWVHIVALTSDRELVLVRQYRHGIATVSSEIPAGAMDPSDASPVVAAARELREETGYVSDDLRYIAKLSPNPATHANSIHVVLAMNAKPLAATAFDPAEEIEIELVTLEDALPLLQSGKLAPALQLSSVFMALAAAGILSLEAL